MFSSIKAKIQPLVTKLRFLTTPAFWTTTIFTKIRQFFSKLLDIRPKHKKDYYSIGRWLVSKRLAFSIVIVLGVVCAVYINSVLPKKSATEGAGSVPTYKYNAIPLKFYDGTVNILAKDGHLAFTGQVADGQVSGSGTLFDATGSTLYEGNFEENLFNGKGQLFYPEGGLKYDGEFVNNLFHGAGSFYRMTGSLEYEGQHLAGVRAGHGKLYNSAGNAIFEGTFQNNNIVYNELIDKATADVASMYIGKASVYSTSNEYCVSMDEINAVYSAKDGSNSLDGKWTVDAVYILSGTATIGNNDYSTIDDLTAFLGTPDYFGTAWVNLPESICINALVKSGCETLSPVKLSSTSELDGVYAISSYDKNATVYLYTFINDGLLYTFYCPEAGSSTFLMYSISLV